MPLVLAAQDREILAANRLKVVVAQAKFPAIYVVNTPAGIAAFQNAIRETYPIAEERATILRVRVLPEGGIGSDRAEPGPWRFLSEDGLWIVALSQDSLSLETTAYGAYEDFRERAAALFSTLVEVLRPARLERFGFRFLNELALPGTRGLRDWREYIDHDLLGVLANGDLVERVTFALQQINLDLDEGKIVFKHGYAPKPDDAEAPSVYLIDIDAYDDQPAPFEVEAIIGRMNRYNDWAWNLFRANVSDTLVEHLRKEGAAR